jgi:hypothetical protein
MSGWIESPTFCIIYYEVGLHYYIDEVKNGPSLCIPIANVSSTIEWISERTPFNYSLCRGQRRESMEFKIPSGWSVDDKGWVIRAVVVPM